MNSPVLSLTDVKKSYLVGSRRLSILNGIDLQIQNGEFVAIMGASGSGKSTLLHIMSGLDHPTSGTVVFDGANMAHMSDSQLARMRNASIGFVFQNFFLLNTHTALQNVHLPLSYSLRPMANSQKGESILAQVGLSGRLHHRPNEMSGGEKQRVAIARALINRPKILFADEPTGALDSKTGDAILSILEDIHRKGTTVVLITHDPLVAKRAGRILHMSDGMLL